MIDNFSDFFMEELETLATIEKENRDRYYKRKELFKFKNEKTSKMLSTVTLIQSNVPERIK